MKPAKVQIQKRMKKMSENKISLRTLILNLKAQQPALINLWNSKQLSTLYSAKLYILFLRKVLLLLDKDSASLMDVKSKISNLVPIVTGVYDKRSLLASKRCILRSRQQLPTLKVRRGNSFSSLAEPKDTEIQQKPNIQPAKKFCCSQNRTQKLMERPLIFCCEDCSLMKEILIDDPMWSSGSLSICPPGRSPITITSHLSGKFLMVGSIPKDSSVPHDDLVEHERCDGETCERNTCIAYDKFTSPAFTSTQKCKQLFDSRADSSDFVVSSPWKHSPSSLLNLAPYIL